MRQRRSRDESRQRILEAAEKRLSEGGPEAVRVQLVAADVGLTDAAVHHHFGSREGLMQALLRFAGRRLKQELAEATAGWDERAPDLRALAERIADTFQTRGHARLALWLTLAGWRESGSGMFRPLAEALHRVRVERARANGRPAPPLDDTLLAVAQLNLALVAEPFFAAPMLRAVGLGRDAATRRRLHDWLVALLERLLLDDGS